MLYRRLRTPLASMLASAVLIALSGSAHAQAPAVPNALRISGFGTLGVTHANTPYDWGYRRDFTQPLNDGGLRGDIDSRLGVQANYTLNSQIEFVGQLVAKRRTAYAAEDVVEWAFAAWRPRSDVTVRVGRVNLDVFLMSEYRDVGFAYPFARPPVDYYGVLPSNLDGGDVSKIWNVDGVQWRLKGFAGQSLTGDRGVAMGATRIRPVYGAMLSRDADGLLLRATVAQTWVVRTPSDLAPLVDGLGAVAALPVSAVATQAAALRDKLDFTSGHLTYLALGANYEDNGWLAMAEVTRLSGQAAIALSSGYATLGRRVGPVTLFGTLSAVRSKAGVQSPPDWQTPLTPVIGAAAAQQAQGLANIAVDAGNVSRGDQRTVSLGMRWDVRPDAALKLQWDHVNMRAYGSGLLYANASDRAEHADVVSLSLDFIF